MAAGPDDRTHRPTRAGSLDALLARCVVRIEDGTAFCGSGFFVAPGEILTCAHVVHRATELRVVWDGGLAPATPVAVLPALAGDDHRAGFYPFPDVALLRLSEAVEHPCVRLDPDEPQAGAPPEALLTVAWTADEYVPDTPVLTTATFEVEGPLRTGDGRLVKLKNGQVAHGFSGGPLLNLRSAGVCALVDSTRDDRSDLGGFGVPLAVLLDDLPGLFDRNRAFHGRDNRWRRAVEQGRVTRVTQQTRLPLSPPMAELDRDGSHAELLHPRYGVVPFLGRDALLANLMLWRERPDPLRIAVLTGPGGFGKTRTAVEACLGAERAGWTVGLLAGSESRPFAGLDELAAWPGRLFVAVDYAETRPPGAVAELLRCLLGGRVDAPVRVVLVMRQGGTRDELRDLIATGERRLELERLVRSADLVRMDRDVAEIDRAELYQAAAQAFAQRLAPSSPPPVPDLAAEHFARPLFVLAAALLGISDQDVDVATLAADDVLGVVLDRHEAEYWDRWSHRLGISLSREQQRRAVALVALLGAETQQDALSLVGMVPGLGEVSDGRRHDVVRWLAHLYGRVESDTVVRPLEPDLLAEVLVARELAAGDRA